MVDHVSQLQNYVASWFVGLCNQLLDEGDVLLASANRHNAEGLVDDLDLCNLWVELVGVVVHLQLDFEAIAVPLDAEAVFVYQWDSESVEVEIYFQFRDRVLNLLAGRFYFFYSFLEGSCQCGLDPWKDKFRFGSFRLDNYRFRLHFFLLLNFLGFLAWAKAGKEWFALSPFLHGPFVAIKICFLLAHLLTPGFDFIVVNCKQDFLKFLSELLALEISIQLS